MWTGIKPITRQTSTIHNTECVVKRFLRPTTKLRSPKTLVGIKKIRNFVTLQLYLQMNTFRHSLMFPHTFLPHKRTISP